MVHSGFYLMYLDLTGLSIILSKKSPSDPDEGGVSISLVDAVVFRLFVLRGVLLELWIVDTFVETADDRNNDDDPVDCRIDLLDASGKGMTILAAVNITDLTAGF